MIELAPGTYRGAFAAPTTGQKAEIEFLQQQLQALVPALLEVVRVNTELARTVVSKFPEMMESAAVLVRAAGDAGISRREALAEPDAAEACRPRSPKPSAKGTPSATTTLQAIAAQVVPAVVAAFAPCRPDVSPAPPVDDAQAPLLSAAGPVQQGGESCPLAEREHLFAVSAELAPTERALMHAFVEELAPTHRRAWLQSLQNLSVPDAVTQVRALLEMPSGSAEMSAVMPRLISPKDAPRSDPSLLPSLMRNAGSFLLPVGAASIATSGRAQPAWSSGFLRWRSPRDAMGGAEARASPSPRLLSELSNRARFVALLSELTAPLRALARSLADELRGNHRLAWFRELAALPFSAAVAHLRTLLAPCGPERSASAPEPWGTRSGARLLPHASLGAR